MKYVQLKPQIRSFIQYVGAEGYEPISLKAQDAEGNQYSMGDGVVWSGWLLAKFKDDKRWQSLRPLTEDDIEQIEEANTYEN